MSEKLTQGPRVGYDLVRVGAGLTRGPTLKKTMTAAAWSNTWPAPGATLDLDFANNRGFVRGVGQGGAMDAVTFTRASSGNWVDSTGTLRSGGGTFIGSTNALGQNLISYPQNFESWSLNGSSAFVTPDATLAPDKTRTADLFVRNATGSGMYCRYGTNQSINTTYTLSVYAKNINTTWLYIRNVAAGTFAWFNLVSGTVGSVTAGSTSTIQDAGDGWYRCTLTSATGASIPTNSVDVVISSADNSMNGNLGDSAYFWGAQLELGSTATTYYPTNINAPRFDWASTAQVPQTNLLTFTDYFDNAAWSKTGLLAFGSGSVANTTATTDPFGGNNADLIVESTATGGHNVFQAFTSSSACAASIYVKPAGRTWIFVSAMQNNYAWFNLSGSGSVGTQTNTSSATIESLPNGWYRCTVVAAYATTPTFVVGLATGNGVSSYTGDGTSGIYIFGAQSYLSGISPPTYQSIAQPTTNTPLAAASTCNGLLIEESRTNRLLWCRDATQSNWTKTNVTAAKTATGIDGVANAASTLTASADGGTCIQTITLASGSRTSSVSLKRINGTGNVQVSLDGTTWSTVDLSNGLYNRIVLSGTVTNPVVGIKLATSGDAVAMDYGQIEDGAFATTPILTTTATATRSGDVSSIEATYALSVLNLFRGTIYAEHQNVGTYASPWSIQAKSVFTGSMALQKGTFYISNASVPVIPSSLTSLGTSFVKSAVSYRAVNNAIQAIGGYNGLTLNPEYVVPSGTNSPSPILNQITIGSQWNNGNSLSSCIKRLVYVQSKMTAGQIQAITSGAT